MNSSKEAAGSKRPAPANDTDWLEQADATLRRYHGIAASVRPREWSRLFISKRSPEERQRMRVQSGSIGSRSSSEPGCGMNRGCAPGKTDATQADRSTAEEEAPRRQLERGISPDLVAKTSGVLQLADEEVGPSTALRGETYAEHRVLHL